MTTLVSSRPTEYCHDGRLQLESDLVTNFSSRITNKGLGIDIPAVRPVQELPKQAALLEVSPYLEMGHLLDLSTLDASQQLFATALTKLEPRDDKYAETSYGRAFNWDVVMGELKQLVFQRHLTWKRTEFYVVEFRSQLNTDIDKALLFKLDKESHLEATSSGGLLKYWFGSPNRDRRNLATCLWRSKADAVAGGKGPWHKRARESIRVMYQDINIKGLRLVIENDVESWSFEAFA